MRCIIGRSRVRLYSGRLEKVNLSTLGVTALRLRSATPSFRLFPTQQRGLITVDDVTNNRTAPSLDIDLATPRILTSEDMAKDDDVANDPTVVVAATPAPDEIDLATSSYNSNTDVAKEQLQERTKKLLEASEFTDAEVISVMKEWTRPENVQQTEETEEHILDQILQHWLDSLEGKMPATTEPFEIALQAYRQAGEGSRAAFVLDKWGHVLEGHIELAPTLEAFHAVFDAYRRDRDHKTAASTSLEILDFLERTHSAGHMSLVPQVETYALVLCSVCHVPQDDSTLRETLLNKCEKAYRELATPKTRDLFYFVLAHCQVATHETLSRLDEVLEKPLSWTLSIAGGLTGREMLQQHAIEGETQTVEEMLAVAYRKAMRKQDDSMSPVDAAQQAEELLAHMEGLSNYYASLPDPDHYTIAIQAWAKCYQDNNEIVGDVNPTLRCEELLSRMEARHLTRLETIPMATYERVLRVLCQSGQSKRAEDLLFHVMGLHEQLPIPMSILTRCWKHVMEVAGSRTLDLYQRMQSYKVIPHKKTLLTVLRALSESKLPNAAAKAQSLLREMEPAANRYLYVLVAWSRSSHPNAPQNAELLLGELEQKYDECQAPEVKPILKPVAAHYSAVITAWSRSSHPDAANKAALLLTRMRERGLGDTEVMPDIVSYGALLESLSRQKTKESAERAEAMLNHLEELSLHKPDLRPNKLCYTPVISAWARLGDLERALAVLERQKAAYRASDRDESLLPDSVTYGSLISAFAKSKTENALDQMEGLLESMEQDEFEAAVRPNSIIYTHVMVAYWKSDLPDAAQKAEGILANMQERYSQGDIDSKPDDASYSPVILAWGRSPLPDKAERAWALVQQMCESYSHGNLDVQPNVIHFTGVLNACAHTQGSEEHKKRAVAIALEVMAEMQKHNVKPNERAFAALLEVFGHQVSSMKERVKYSSIAFERCCQAGLLNPKMIETLRKKVPSLYERLPRDQDNNLQLPKSWYKRSDIRRR